MQGCSPTFPAPAPAPTTIDHNKRNVERQYRVEASIKGKVKVKKPLRRYTRDEKARIIEYHKNHPNMSYGKIANKLGCSKTTVHRIIKGDDT
jgi:DNA invertase Pin-like site-specific DNA recombinase